MVAVRGKYDEYVDLARKMKLSNMNLTDSCTHHYRRTWNSCRKICKKIKRIGNLSR